MQIPLSLTRHLSEGRCILFVGAGLSGAAKLPTWGGLLDEVIKELESNDDADAAELRTLWRAKKYLEVADHCADAKSAQLRTTLMGLVRGATEPVPEVHKILRTLPFAGIVTTNYDKLVERAFWEAGLVPKVHTHASKDAFGTLLFDRAFFILKAHGDIDEPETIVLSTKSYRDLIHANPAFNAVMSAILLNFSILFVGYSLNDPDFRLLIERQISDFKGTTPIRYALMGGIGPVEAQILRRNAGIQVIHYPKDKHSEVLIFFQQLQAKVQAEQAKKVTASPIALPQVDLPTAAPAAPVPSKQKTATRTRGKASFSKLPTEFSAQRTQDQPVKADVAISNMLTRFTPILRLRSAGQTIEATFEKSPAATTLSSIAKRAAILGGLGGLGPLSFVGGVLGSILAPATTPLVSRIDVVDWSTLADAVGKAIGTVGKDSRKAIGVVGLELRKCFSAEIIAALESVESNHQISIIAEPPLETVPWEWLDVGGQPLCIARPVFRHVPSDVAHMPLPPSVLVIGDPQGNLPGAAAEAKGVAKVWEADVSFLNRSEATFANVLDLLEARRFDVLHFAGHAWVEDGQSYLYLADSVGIGARELRSFFSRNPPAIAFMNSHYTAFVPIGVSVVGVDNVTIADRRMLPTNVFAFLNMATSAGVGAFIGCFGNPTDDGARQFGLAFHQKIGTGASAAEALFHARTTVANSRPNDATPLLYVGSGIGWLRGVAATGGMPSC